ncbi:MAG: helix-turn-helix domain-containing protein [Firmicutes bacterium]|nr:helix-turn-helix domain-containing protein [Bacillota bacterium]
MSERSGLPNLRRIRLAEGLTQDGLAKAAGISRLTYQKIESGESIPKITTLQSIARALGVQIQDLLVPVEIPSKIRFRAFKRLNTREAVILDVARWLRDYSDLEKRLGRENELAYALDSLAEELKGRNPGRDRAIYAAGRARTELGIGEEGSIRDICGLLESAGIKVYPKAVATDAFFGLSIGPGDGGPAIVVNTWDRISVERWIFTAAHELGHLLLHLEAFDVNQTEEEKNQEEEANVFAGYFLMPETVFRREWEEAGGWPLIDRVLKVKRIFHVSYRTVLYRLQDKIPDIWKKFQIEYKQRYGKTLNWKEEPDPLTADFWASFPEPHRAHEPDNIESKQCFVPDRLVKLVRAAIEEGKITLSRGAEILRIDLETMRAWAASWSGA